MNDYGKDLQAAYDDGYAQGKKDARQWIPTKTRLPEKSGVYLVTKQQKTGAAQIATAHWDKTLREWRGNGNFKKILAWMELPMPYSPVARMLPPQGMYGSWYCEKCGERVDSKDGFCCWCGAAFVEPKEHDYELIRSEK